MRSPRIPRSGGPSNTSSIAVPAGMIARRRPINAAGGCGWSPRDRAWSRFDPSTISRDVFASGSRGRSVAACLSLVADALRQGGEHRHRSFRAFLEDRPQRLAADAQAAHVDVGDHRRGARTVAEDRQLTDVVARFIGPQEALRIRRLAC